MYGLEIFVTDLPDNFISKLGNVLHMNNNNRFLILAYESTKLFNKMTISYEFMIENNYDSIGEEHTVSSSRD